MTGNHSDQMASRIHPPGGPGKWEPPVVPIREARDVVLQLARTVNTRRIHLPNNPIYQKFLGDLSAKVGSY